MQPPRGWVQFFFFRFARPGRKSLGRKREKQPRGGGGDLACSCVCVCWGAHVLGVVHSTPSDQSFPRWWWCYFYCSCESRVTLISPVTFVLLA